MYRALHPVINGSTNKPQAWRSRRRFVVVPGNLKQRRNNGRTSTPVRSHSPKVSCAFINTPLHSCPSELWRVFAYPAPKSHIQLICMFPFRAFFSLFSTVPLWLTASVSGLFSGPGLQATSFIEKCLFHFRTDRQTKGVGIRYLSEVDPDNKRPPLGDANRPRPPLVFVVFFPHKRDT